MLIQRPIDQHPTLTLSVRFQSLVGKFMSLKLDNALQIQSKANIISTLNNRKKYEIATDEVGNFIKQDEKKGVLREVSSAHMNIV